MSFVDSRHKVRVTHEPSGLRVATPFGNGGTYRSLHRATIAAKRVLAVKVAAWRTGRFRVENGDLVAIVDPDPPTATETGTYYEEEE